MTSILAAIACLLAVTLGYGGLCAASPFGRCRKCNGLGFQLRHDRRGTPRRGKHCLRCKGHGLRIRVGRWIFNRAAALYRDGTP